MFIHFINLNKLQLKKKCFMFSEASDTCMVCEVVFFFLKLKKKLFLPASRLKLSLWFVLVLWAARADREVEKE